MSNLYNVFCLENGITYFFTATDSLYALKKMKYTLSLTRNVSDFQIIETEHCYTLQNESQTQTYSVLKEGGACYGKHY